MNGLGLAYYDYALVDGLLDRGCSSAREAVVGLESTGVGTGGAAGDLENVFRGYWFAEEGFESCGMAERLG